MKAVWIDAGNDPYYTKLKAGGFDSCYFDMRDQRLTPVYLGQVAKRGLQPGIYAAANWYPTLDGPGFARTVDSFVRDMGDDTPNLPRVLLDIETHDIAGYVVPCLQQWRALRPTRVTAWTFEGMQGGLFDGPAVTAIKAAKVRLLPQFYRGSMEPLTHSPVIDLLMAGLPGERIDGMYDAAALPYRWRGCAFSQGRLP